MTDDDDDLTSEQYVSKCPGMHSQIHALCTELLNVSGNKDESTGKKIETLDRRLTEALTMLERLSKDGCFSASVLHSIIADLDHITEAIGEQSELDPLMGVRSRLAAQITQTRKSLLA